jgi:hypothetical protein
MNIASCVKPPLGFLVMLACVLAGPRSAGASPVIQTIARDGAWTWFNDERAVLSGNILFAGYVRRDGQICVTAYDIARCQGIESELSSWKKRDDHNNPALLLRRDGRLMAFYSTHGFKPFWNYRVTEASPSRLPLAWGPEQAVDLGAFKLNRGVTYNNVFELSAEPGHIYNFMRGIQWNPTLNLSDDDGQTWRPPVHLIRWPDRPYVRYASNGRDRIDLAFTEGSPATASNSIYHVYLQGGVLHRTDGSPVAKLGESTPIEPRQATEVFRFGSVYPGANTWIWDIALDRRDAPVIVHLVRISSQDHRYFYATYDRKLGTWTSREAVKGGGCLTPPKEPSYSGGIALDPRSPSHIYVSTPLDPRNGHQTEHREIYTGTTRDAGRTWKWRSLTENSASDNLRPYVVRNKKGKHCVLWFRGTYRAYTDFQTEIVGGFE